MITNSLRFFENNNSYSIIELSNWINQNKELYNYCLRNSYNITFEQEDDNLLKLCNKNRNENNINFCSFYDCIVEFIEFHNLETIAESEIYNYEKIKTNKIEIRNWLIKNEKLGCEDLCLFAWDFFQDEEINLKIKDVNLYQQYYKDIEIFVHRNDFKSIIAFCEIFNELYYIKNFI